MTIGPDDVATHREDSRQRIERLVAEGKMPREAVRIAERLWRTRLRRGIALPNGERAVVTRSDLYHLIVDDRIWRNPERIERILVSIFEIRTARSGRRKALSRWEESGRVLAGYAILSEGNRVWTMHVIDERKLRRELNKGDVLWRR